MLHAFSLTLTLSVLWLLLSGHFAEPPSLLRGLVSLLAVVVIFDRMAVPDHDGHGHHRSRRSLLSWPWLLKNIVLAQIDVAKAIRRHPPAIAPTVLQVQASQTSALGRVIHAPRRRSRLAS